MSKRQIRISDHETIRRRLGEFVNKKMNIVLKNNMVLFVELKKAGDPVVIMNMRREEQDVPVADIAELFIDVDA